MNNTEVEPAFQNERYYNEQNQKIYKTGKVFSLTAIVCLLYFILQDIYIAKKPEFAPVRLIALLPAAVYFIAVHTVISKKISLVRIFHFISLTSLNIMMLVYNSMIFTSDAYSQGDKAAVSSALIVTIFIIYVFIFSLRKHIIYIVGVPFIIFIILMALFADSNPEELAYFSSVAIAAVAAIVLGYIQENMTRSEFSMRMLALGKTLELETEIKKVSMLNNELQDILQEKKVLEDRLTQMAMFDSQTGSYNRAPGLERLTGDIIDIKKGNSVCTLCYIDIDDLKKVNDQYGHAEGDCLIKSLVDYIKGGLKESDYIIRMGGDELLIVMKNKSEIESRNIINNIRDRISGEEPENSNYKIRFSVGFFELLSACELSFESMLALVDKRMYEEKKLKKATHMSCVGSNRD